MEEAFDRIDTLVGLEEKERAAFSVMVVRMDHEQRALVLRKFTRDTNENLERFVREFLAQEAQSTQGVAAGPGAGSAGAGGSEERLLDRMAEAVKGSEERLLDRVAEAVKGRGAAAGSSGAGVEGAGVEEKMTHVVKAVSQSVGRLMKRPSGEAGDGGAQDHRDFDHSMSVGSCVLINSHGLLITANHIITEHGPDGLVALFPSGMLLTGLQLGNFSDAMDVCLLEPNEVVNGPVPVPATLGEFSKGQHVVAVGYPLVIDNYITDVDLSSPSAFVGFLAQSGPAEHVASYMGFPNSSGCGVFNGAGQLIGIHTGTISAYELLEDSDLRDQLQQLAAGNLTEASVFTDIRVALATLLEVQASPLTKLSQKRRRRQQVRKQEIVLGRQLQATQL